MKYAPVARIVAAALHRFAPVGPNERDQLSRPAIRLGHGLRPFGARSRFLLKPNGTAHDFPNRAAPGTAPAPHSSRRYASE